jgi:hypothetical protein
MSKLIHYTIPRRRNHHARQRDENGKMMIPGDPCAAECSDGRAHSLYEATPLHAARRLAAATRGFLIVGLLVLPASSVQAIECRAEPPAHRNGHWSYRIIDGRKCWYQGKSMISKSLLHWPASNIAPKKATDAGLVTAVPSPPKTGLDLVSWCPPQLGVAENFESRWQGIFGSVLPRALFDPVPVSEWSQQR